MRGWWLGVGLLVACRPPALPPVPPGRSVVVDGLPARVRQLVLVAELELADGNPEAARMAAEQAVRLDQEGGPPRLLLARARAATGDAAGALEAVTAAIEQHPQVLEARVLRMGLDGDGSFRTIDEQAILAHRSEARRPWLAALSKVTPPNTHLAHALSLDARQWVYSAPVSRLPELLATLQKHGGQLAVVVAALRQYRAGEGSEAAQNAAVSVLAASGCDGSGWTPAPPEWALVVSQHTFRPAVGYQPAPDHDVGWMTACSGDRHEAVALLKAAQKAAPDNPTLAEQLWLTQHGWALR